LERLKPSLEKHRGCDIIDINPGAALFSAKLHDHLQPRTHILLEPDKTYMPLIEPLINPPASKYTLLPKSGLVWGHLEKVLCKEYLPFQKPLDNNDPKLEKPNDTLLVVANLGLYPKRTYRGFPSLAVLVIHQLLSAIHAHSLFQRYGLVRMLVWLHDDETYTILPKTLSARRKSALEAEITCESISEVVSSTAPYTMFRRFAALDIKRFSQVKKRMEEAGITVPSKRESDLMQNFNEGRTGYEDTENFTADFLRQLADLEASYEKGEFQETLDVSHLSTNPFNGKDLAGAKVINTPEFVRLQECRWRYQTQIRKKAKWMDLIFEYENIISLQKKIFMCKDATETENLKENLKISTKAWKDDFDELSATSQDIALAAIYEKIAFDVEPPVLMWDRRAVEPLKAHAEEFHPPRPMSLIDIQPKSVWPILRKNYPDNFDILDYIVCQLYIIPTQSMKRGLTALAPGAYEWLVAECPALTDPTKGGNLDLDFMPVRMVSMEMLEQMVEAWARWPFRPSKFELMTRLGSSVHDDLDDDAQFK
jgi:transcription factor 1